MSSDVNPPPPAADAWLASACAVVCALRRHSHHPQHDGPHTPQAPHPQGSDTPRGAQADAHDPGGSGQGQEPLLRGSGVSLRRSSRSLQGQGRGIDGSGPDTPMPQGLASGDGTVRDEGQLQGMHTGSHMANAEGAASEQAAIGGGGGGQGAAPHVLWQVSWKCRCRESERSGSKGSGGGSGHDGGGLSAAVDLARSSSQQRSGGNGGLNIVPGSHLHLHPSQHLVTPLASTAADGPTPDEHDAKGLPNVRPGHVPGSLRAASRKLSSHSSGLPHLPQLPQLPPELLPPPQNLQSLVDALNNGGVNVRIAVNGGVYNVQIPPLPAVSAPGPGAPPAAAAQGARGAAARPPDSNGALGLKLSDLKLDSGR